MASAQCREIQELLSSTGSSFDRFGVSVDIDGNVAVVGAYLDDPMGTDSGSASVFSYDGTQWTETGWLAPMNGTPHDHFGRAVAISGEFVVIGAYADDPMGTDSGSAYVYRFVGSQWVETQQLVPSNGAGGDNFGLAVAIDGDTIVVGARLDNTTSGADAGSAYVFQYRGPVFGWVQQQNLVAANAAAGDQFGSSVSVCSDVIVVGAAQDDTTAGVNAGSAYLFQYDAASFLWEQQQQIFASNGASSDALGGSCSVSDGVLVVGADLHDDSIGGGDSGSAYVFHRDPGQPSGSQWFEQQVLLANNRMAGDRFGRSVSVDGDVIVVGAFLHDTPGFGTNSGTTSLFRRVGNTWLEEPQIAASQRSSDDYGGFSVAVSGDHAIVGAYLDNTSGGSDAGSASIFPASEMYLRITPTCTGPAGTPIKFEAACGLANSFTLLAIREVNQLPTFLPVLIFPFGNDHWAVLPTLVTPSSLGHTVLFQAFKAGRSGIVGSNLVEVVFGGC
jgi:hypothetical protein